MVSTNLKPKQLRGGLSKGFTIIELVVTITIMGILLSLAVANVDSSQRNARDVERKGDIEAIQLSLEDYYKYNDTRTYPDISLATGTVDNMLAELKDISIESLRAPGVSNAQSTFIAAINANQTTGGVLPLPSKDQYVYQPIWINDSNVSVLCSSGNPCRKYNLFYRLETDGVVYKVTSRHQ